MTNQNDLENLIAEELTLEDQTTIAGGMSISNIGAIVNNNEDLIDDTDAANVTASINISFIEKNTYYS